MAAYRLGRELQREAQPRRLLITGCPRSGTTYLAMLMQAYGLEVGHERAGRHGISSFALAVDGPDGPWGPARRRYRFERVIHIVRDPVAAIASFATMGPRAWQYFNAYIYAPPSLPVVHRGALAWVGWNRLIEAQPHDVRLRVEDAATALPALLHSWGWPAVRRGPLPPSNTNTRPHGPLTWSDIEDALPPDLFAELAAMAARYGYPSPPATEGAWLTSDG